MRGCTRLLLYFNTNKPHSFFFCRIPVLLENRRSSQGRGGAHPLHPPLRSAPAIIIVHSIHLFLSFYVGKHHRVNLQFSFSRCVIIFNSSSWINTLCYVMLHVCCAVSIAWQWKPSIDSDPFLNFFPLFPPLTKNT